MITTWYISYDTYELYDIISIGVPNMTASKVLTQNDSIETDMRVVLT